MVDAPTGSPDPLVLILRRLPVVLPELTAGATLPVPSLNLQVSAGVDEGLVGRGQRPEPGGAAMNEDGVAIVRYRFPWADTVSRVQLRRWRRGLGATSERFFAVACHRGPAEVLATKLEGGLNPRFWDLDASLQIHGGWLSGVNGSCDPPKSLKLSGTPQSAAGVSGGWMILRIAEDQSHRLAQVTDGGQLLWDLSLDSLASGFAFRGGETLAESQFGGTIASRTWPFNWIEVDSAGQVTVRSQKGPNGEGPDPSVVRGWRAYSVFRLATGFAQTVEAPNGRERRILLYDLIGRFSKEVRLSNVPILIASAPGSRRLLGIRNRNAIGSIVDLLEFSY